MQIDRLQSEFLHMIYALKSCMDRVIEPIVLSEGLTCLQTMILQSIAEGLITTVGAISKHTGMGQANASTLCKKLERDGYLSRTRSQRDERVVELSLTEQGRAALDGIRKRLEVFDPILQQIDDSVYEQINTGFRNATSILSYLATKLPPEQERSQK